MSRFTGDSLAYARRLVSLYPQRRSALIPLCHLAQAQDGWLTSDAMEHIAELLELEPAEVLGTASFYDMLHTEPVGRYLIGICTNIACLLEGGMELLEHAAKRLGVHPGGTTGDGVFTLEEVECVAACNRAPCATVNWRFFGPLGADSFDRLVDDLAAGRLDQDVPRHGVLSRTVRRRGLDVAPEDVAAERERSDREKAGRLAASATEAPKAATAGAPGAQAPKGSSGGDPQSGKGSK